MWVVLCLCGDVNLGLKVVLQELKREEVGTCTGLLGAGLELE